MPPSRNQAAEPKKRKAGHRKQPAQDTLELPGVQKLKSALRQTRRLLAKDNLAADVRVETERRLKSLENDLALAETKKKERAFATKYHMVKFFERKKIMRKIARVKKDLDSSSPSSSKSTSELESRLFDLRVDLNYILHFPKLQKYISLFPNKDTDKAMADDADETNKRRRLLREEVQRRMEAEELSLQPEDDEHNAQFVEDVASAAASIQSTKKAKSRTQTNTSQDQAQKQIDPPASHDDFFEKDDSDESASGS